MTTIKAEIRLACVICLAMVAPVLCYAQDENLRDAYYRVINTLIDQGRQDKPGSLADGLYSDVMRAMPQISAKHPTIQVSHDIVVGNDVHKLTVFGNVLEIEADGSPCLIFFRGAFLSDTGECVAHNCTLTPRVPEKYAAFMRGIYTEEELAGMLRSRPHVEVEATPSAPP